MQGAAVPTNIYTATGTGQLLTLDGGKAKGRLHCVALAAGADDATVTIHDHASAASGKLLAKITVKAGTTYQLHVGRTAFSNGLYATVTGTTPVVQVVVE
jgi:hypothetical protein